jgi:hypothetical protein
MVSRNFRLADKLRHSPNGRRIAAWHRFEGIAASQTGLYLAD